MCDAGAHPLVFAVTAVIVVFAVAACRNYLRMPADTGR